MHVLKKTMTCGSCESSETVIDWRYNIPLSGMSALFLPLFLTMNAMGLIYYFTDLD